MSTAAGHPPSVHSHQPAVLPWQRPIRLRAKSIARMVLRYWPCPVTVGPVASKVIVEPSIERLCPIR